MKAYRLMTLFVLAAGLLAACTSPTAGEDIPNSGLPGDQTPAPQDGGPGVLLPAGEAALDMIADITGMRVEDLKVANIEQVTWTDSCLGLGGAAESCLMAETPGFRVRVLAGSRLYTLHTDATGASVRQVPVDGFEPATQEQAAQAAVAFISAVTEQAASAITVESVEAIDWPDACLGVSIPNVMCAQVITSGYKVLVNAGGQTYEVHTDLSASNLALAAQP